MPALALPPATPSTVQVTALSLLPVTVAVRLAVAPALMLTVPGLSATDTATGGWTTTGAWTVMVVVALWVASAALVATMAWLPAAAGAV